MVRREKLSATQPAGSVNMKIGIIWNRPIKAKSKALPVASYRCQPMPTIMVDAITVVATRPINSPINAFEYINSVYNKTAVAIVILSIFRQCTLFILLRRQLQLIKHKKGPTLWPLVSTCFEITTRIDRLA